MAATCVQGGFGQLAVKQGTGAVDFSTGTPVRIPFYHEDLILENTSGVPDVIVGSRTVPSERARLGPSVTRGTIYFPISSNELDTLLPLICGTAEATNVFALAETVPTFAVLMDKVSKVYKYTDGVVNKALFRGVQSGPGAPPNFVVLALECWFKDEDDSSLTFPTLTMGLTAGFSPYVFEDGVVTLAGTAYTPKAWNILIHNHIEQRWINSLTPVTNCPARRSVHVSFKWPSDSDHITNLRKVATAGLLTNTVTLTNGAASLSFAFACLQSPRKTPFITGHTEIDFDTNFVARGLSTTKELIITNVGV